MEFFEKLLAEHRAAIERFVKFKLPSASDADDILQEVNLPLIKNSQSCTARMRSMRGCSALHETNAVNFSVGGRDA